MAILAIDAGTTGVTALIVNTSGEIASKGYQEFAQHFPEPGWVEHEPEEIWQATLAATQAALDKTDLSPTVLGITNQRETAVVWDRKSLASPTKAIVWQDRRTANLKHELDQLNKDDWIRARTGLNIDPYFTSSKFLWWKRNLPEVWQGVENGSYALGTIDSYLAARLSGGRLHITDASNASRTQLMDLASGQWDQELCQSFGVPISALPLITPSWGNLGTTDPNSFLGLSLEITGIAGDQQAALFGQLAFEPGSSKCTYGTGAFILTNTGNAIVPSEHQLLSTVAWKSPSGEVTYASEGSVFAAGAAVQWLRDGLGIIQKSAEVESLAREEETNGGVVFVPALTGLGAPFWDSEVRGTILGITRGTNSSHIARATLEAIAFQVNAVAKAMESDIGTKLVALRVDGGAAANDLLLQMQADLLGCEVVRAKNLESTGFGAALLAGLGSGIWESFEQIIDLNPPQSRFSPEKNRTKDYELFLKAVEVASEF